MGSAYCCYCCCCDCPFILFCCYYCWFPKMLESYCPWLTCPLPFRLLKDNKGLPYFGPAIIAVIRAGAGHSQKYLWIVGFVALDLSPYHNLLFTLFCVGCCCSGSPQPSEKLDFPPGGLCSFTEGVSFKWLFKFINLYKFVNFFV